MIWTGKFFNVSVIPSEGIALQVIEAFKTALEETILNKFNAEKIDYDIGIDELYKNFEGIDDQKHIFVV